MKTRRQGIGLTLFGALLCLGGKAIVLGACVGIVGLGLLCGRKE